MDVSEHFLRIFKCSNSNTLFIPENFAIEFEIAIDSSVYKNVDIVYYKYLFWQHFETLSGKIMELITCQDTHICERKIDILETQRIGIQ